MKPRAMLVNPVFNTGTDREGAAFEYLTGHVYGHPVLADGRMIRTSKIRAVDYGTDVNSPESVETLNTCYELVYNPYSDQLPDCEADND